MGVQGADSCRSRNMTANISDLALNVVPYHQILSSLPEVVESTLVSMLFLHPGNLSVRILLKLLKHGTIWKWSDLL